MINFKNTNLRDFPRVMVCENFTDLDNHVGLFGRLISVTNAVSNDGSTTIVAVVIMESSFVVESVPVDLIRFDPHHKFVSV